MLRREIGILKGLEEQDWAEIHQRIKRSGDPSALAVVTTWKGRDIETGRMIGGTPTQAEPRFLTWGTNNGGVQSFTAAATDVALFQERVGSETRTAITAGTQQTTAKVNDTIQWQGTITATGTVTIAECGLFDSSTQPGLAVVTTGATSVIGSATNTNLYTTVAYNPGQNNYVQIRTEFMKITDANGNSTAHTVTRMTSLAANLGGGSGSIATIAASDGVQGGNPPGQTGIAGGSMLLHADHSPDGLGVGDSIQYTISIQLT